MSTIRPVLIALIALSVAFLPLAGGLAFAMPHEGGIVASDADCCPDGKPCEKKTNRCGVDSACMLKCSGLMGVSAAPPTLLLTISAMEEATLDSSAFCSPGEHPPLPPPRA
jgi:hypothetical protein